jgi:4-amino-4-deoxy-L-arabinose transferase
LVTYFLKTELVERVSSAAVHNREWYSPFIIYLPALLAGQGAWLYFSARGLWRFTRVGPRRIMSFFKDNEGDFFMFLWITIPLLIFSISRSRLELYVLPLYAPIALLVARWISGYEGIAWKRLAIVAVISVILLAGLKFGIANFPNRNNMKQVYQMSLEMGSKNADYFVFEDNKLYGMQYYLNGMMQRVTLTGQESWADAGIDNLLSSLRSAKITTEYLILANKKKSPRIESALSDPDLDVQKTEDKHWIWYRVTQKPQ